MRDATRHWLVSDEIDQWRLWLHDYGTGLSGEALGQCRRGGPFIYDAFAAYEAGLISGPNIAVMGSIGSGKSTLVKMLALRASRQEYGVVIVDPKGEYHEVARAVGGSILELTVGGTQWCNPFDGDRARDLLVALTLLELALHRSVSEDEKYLFEREWNEVGGAERPLLRVYERLASSLLTEEVSSRRSLALALRRFIEGDLRGLFDGSDPAVDLSRGLVVLDLSQLWSRGEFALACVATMAAAQRPTHGRRYLLIDEAWAVINDAAAARWLQGSWKMARATGVSHVIVLHRWSDTESSAGADSAHRARVMGLVRDCDTHFVFHLSANDAALLTPILDLHPREQALIPELARGSALVRYGPWRSVLEVRPLDAERALVDSDHAMRRS
ncbi:MAG: DUF87 domain-containing protein [Actinomycetota bacterium]|jgi:hypothetical protein